MKFWKEFPYIGDLHDLGIVDEILEDEFPVVDPAIGGGLDLEELLVAGTLHEICFELKLKTTIWILVYIDN